MHDLKGGFSRFKTTSVSSICDTANYCQFIKASKENVFVMLKTIKNLLATT